MCRGGESEEIARFGRYADTVCREISSRAEEIRSTLPDGAFSGKVDTLYIGGGTPSVLPLPVLDRIVRTLNEVVYGAAGHDYVEFTVEVNPEDIIEKGEDYLRGLISMGVNRISMGVQSFDDRALRWMNRRHDAAGAEEAYWMMRGQGIRNISIDLIYGIGGLEDRTWDATLRKAVGLSPSHISAYQLSVEEGSALARIADEGGYEEASDEDCRRQYDILCSALYDAGYHHYEVSNFAYPGFEALHNSSYWRRIPYVGLGPGAHSAVVGADGKVDVRKWNTETLPEYVSESESLTAEDVAVEEIMLGLRTDRGVEESKIPRDVLRRLLDEKALVRTLYGCVRIPEDRFFVSDDIIRDCISLL